MTDIILPYGKESIRFPVPEGIRIREISPEGLPASPDAVRVLTNSLENPVNSPPLSEILRKHENLLIVIADKTRPSGYLVILPALLDYCNRSGIPDELINLLIAYGSHARQSDDESAEVYGEETVRRVRILHHDCVDNSSLVYAGKTSRVTPVEINRLYAESPARIIVGPVSFHYFAGFGGGRKLVFPGIAGRKGILTNHSYFLGSIPGAGTHPCCKKGQLNGNPVHEDSVEATGIAPPDFAVNILPAKHGGISSVISGDWMESHSVACEVLKKSTCIKHSKSKTVIVSAGGFPRDINMIQSHKAIDNAFDFIEPGGRMLLFAECREGTGSETFLKWFNYKDRIEMENALHDSFDLNGGTALSLAIKTGMVKIYLFSSLPGEVVKKTGMIPVSSVSDSVGKVLSQEISEVLVLPDAHECVCAG